MLGLNAKVKKNKNIIFLKNCHNLLFNNRKKIKENSKSANFKRRKKNLWKFFGNDFWMSFPCLQMIIKTALLQKIMCIALVKLKRKTLINGISCELNSLWNK